MAVTFEQNYYDYYTWAFAFGGGVSSDSYYHAGGNTASFDYFTDTPSIGDEFSFYTPEPMSGVKLEVGTPMDGTPVIVWEWLVGATWYPLRVDNADAITKSGTQVVKWTHPYNYRGTGLNARPGYRYRMRLTDVSGVTEGGANATNKVERLQYSFNVTGTSQTMGSVYSHDLATAYTLLFAQTPQASLEPLECPFMKSGIVGKIDVVLSGCTVGVGDTVVLTGIDFDGSALVETLDVSSGGTATYTTTSCFKDVTDVACNGFNDGTIEVKTKRTGLIQRSGTSLGYIYDIYSIVIFGDNSTTTTVTSTGENWNFQFAASRFCVYGANTEVTLGLMETGGDVSHSYSQVFVYFADWGLPFVPRYFINVGGTINAYGTKFKSAQGSSIPFSTGMGNWNGKQVSVTMLSRALAWQGTWADLDGFWTNSVSFTYGSPTLTGTAQNLVFNSGIDLYNNRGNFAFTNSLFEGFSRVNNLDFTRAITFTDCPGLTTDKITNTATSSQNGDGIYLKNSVNIRVINSRGSVIEGVTVSITDSQGTSLGSFTTDVNGDITEQIITWYKGSWTAGSTGITWVEYSPHTITISKTGYETKKMVIDMDTKREEIVVLQNRREV
jgi:hypothetical protein